MGSNFENPAGRLFKILTSAKLGKDNLPIKQVWANTFELDLNDTSSLLLSVAELINLIRLTKDAIQKIEGIDHKIYLQPFTKIERALAVTNLEANWKSFKNHLDDATMVALQFCSDTLSRQVGENEISKEDLDKLLKEVDALLAKVVKSKLPEEITAFLIDNLENIRRAILTYRIRGATALKHVLESSIGSIFFHRETVKAEYESKQGKTVFQGFFGIIGNLNKLVAFALKTKELAGPVVKLLIGSDSLPES